MIQALGWISNFLWIKTQTSIFSRYKSNFNVVMKEYNSWSISTQWYPYLPPPPKKILVVPL